MMAIMMKHVKSAYFEALDMAMDSLGKILLNSDSSLCFLIGVDCIVVIMQW